MRKLVFLFIGVSITALAVAKVACRPAVADLLVCHGHYADQTPYIYFVNKHYGYTVHGAVFNEQGRNLTKRYLKRWVTPVDNRLAWQHIHTQTHWFAEGSKNAPHVIYVIADPNDKALSLYYTNALEEAIMRGALQVRWVLVGDVNQQSYRLVQRILASKNPLQAWHAYLMNKKKHIDDQSAKYWSGPAQLNKNLRFVLRYRFHDTPITFFKTDDGQLHVVEGLVLDEMLDDVYIKHITRADEN